MFLFESRSFSFKQFVTIPRNCSLYIKKCRMLTEYRHFRFLANKMTAWKAAIPGTVSLFFFSLEYCQARHVSSPPKNGYI